MSGGTLREKAVLATLVMIGLYAVAAAVWFLSAESAWKKAARDYEKQKATYAAEKKKIGEKRLWDERYETEKAAMPSFPAGTDTDTHWLKVMDEMAAAHKVQISQRQGGKEEQVDDVYELPIEVRSWEGSLEALVKFMHELENTDKGMFSICALNFKPSSKKGYLRGSFTLKCAYMRE